MARRAKRIATYCTTSPGWPDRLLRLFRPKVASRRPGLLSPIAAALHWHSPHFFSLKDKNALSQAPAILETLRRQPAAAMWCTFQRSTLAISRLAPAQFLRR